MLGRCPRSSLNRTTSKAELRTDSDEIVHLSCSEDEKPVLQPPHQIVIGFDLGTDSSRNSHIQTAGASPRSVLEPHHLCVRSHHEPVRSPLPPLSLLGTLPSGNPRNLPCVEGVALHFKAAIKAEEAVASGELQHAFPRRGVVAGDVDGVGAFPAVSNREHVAGHSKTNTQNDRLTFSRTSNAEARKDQPCKHGPSNRVSRGSRANCLYAKTLLSSDGEDEDTIEAAAADADSKDVDNLPVSLFSTASQVANNFRSETIAVDFLSKCYLCRRHLVSGKDIYMYRGDRAFCSKECRYKQIVIDERKERHPAAATCVPGASGHHRSFQRTNQAAVA